MSSPYTTYNYIVKEALGVMALGLAGRGLRTAWDGTSAALNLPGVYSGISGRVQTGLRGLGGLRDSAYGVVGTAADTFNVFETPAERERSVAHAIGKELGNFFLPKVYDPDDLGPYEEYSNYLKDTEEGEMWLQEAAVLRRQARKLKRKREKEKQEKEHAAASRYF